MKRIFFTIIIISTMYIANCYGQCGNPKYVNFQKIVSYYWPEKDEYVLVLHSIDKSTDIYHFGVLARTEIGVILETDSGKRVTVNPGRMNIISLEEQRNILDSNAKKYFRFNMVIDNSSSIDDESLGKVQDVLTKFIQNIPNCFEAQIIKFSDEIQIHSPFLTDKSKIIDYINTTKPRNSTCLYDAVYLGIKDLKKETNNIPFNFSIILTDGEDTSSKMELEVFKNNIISESTNSHIPLFIAGVTKNVNESLMKDLTHKYGLYYPLDRFDDVDNAFNEMSEMIKGTYVFRIPASDTKNTKLKKIYITQFSNKRKPKVIQDVCFE